MKMKGFDLLWITYQLKINNTIMSLRIWQLRQGCLEGSLDCNTMHWISNEKDVQEYFQAVVSKMTKKCKTEKFYLRSRMLNPLCKGQDS